MFLKRFEEQKTTTDELGNTETFVTKRNGNQTITQIIKRNNKNQIIESKEQVIDNSDKSKYSLTNDSNVFIEIISKNSLQESNKSEAYWVDVKH